MYRRRSISEPRRGAAVVELAFVLPVMLVLMVGLWDLGQLIRGLQIVSIAAREGGRQAASGTKTTTQIENLVKLIMQQNGVNIANVVFAYTNATQSGVAPNSAAQNDALTVTVSMPFNDLRLGANLYGKWRIGPSILSIQTQWFSMRDVPVNVTTTIPAE
jgi:Flp pilus assembly protein TadG